MRVCALPGCPRAKLSANVCREPFPLRVNMRNPHCEQMLSALLPTTDVIRQRSSWATSITARAVGHCTCGTAATFDEGRADFEAAWRVFLSRRSGKARSARLDGAEICHVGSRRTVAVLVWDRSNKCARQVQSVHTKASCPASIF
jgi:hypothetical protein